MAAAPPCTCPDLAPTMMCAECDGEVRVAYPRRELLRDAVVEAARHYLASYLVHEREENRPPDYEASEDAAAERGDALQALRDALAAERAARGGPRG